MIQQQNANVVPSELSHEEDQLLVAGAKISYLDVYNKQMEIPLVKKKFYKAVDVDNVFVLMNGILTDVSKHAHRQNYLLTESRKDLEEKNQQLEQLGRENEAMREIIMDLQDQQGVPSEELERVTNALNERNREFESLVRQFGEKYHTMAAELESTKMALAEKTAETEQLSQKLAESEDQRFGLIAQLANA